MWLLPLVVVKIIAPKDEWFDDVVGEETPCRSRHCIMLMGVMVIHLEERVHHMLPSPRTDEEEEHG